MADDKQTPEREQAILSTLSQGTVAWIADVSPKTVREWRILRNDDARRSYHIHEVLRLLQKKRPATKLPDAAVEILMQLAEATALDVSQAACHKLRRLCDDFNSDDVLLAFGRCFLKSLGDVWPLDGATSDQSSDEAAAEYVADLQRQAAINALDAVVQCEQCGQTRQGVRWNATQPAPDTVLIFGTCPKCEGKQG